MHSLSTHRRCSIFYQRDARAGYSATNWEAALIDKSLLEHSIEDYTDTGPHFPRWPCPECTHGRLTLERSQVHFGAAARIDEGIESGYLEHWDDQGVFAAIMRCDAIACRQAVAVLGDYQALAHDVGYVIGHGIDGRFGRRFTFRAIHSAPKLVAMASHTPDPIKHAIAKSFPLFWSDLQACAGAMRIAVEEIADHVRPRRSGSNGSPVSLGIHLEDIKTAQPQHADHVEAFRLIVRKLGNPGAHGDAIDRDRVIDAYELLEIEIGKLFEETRRTELMDRLNSP